MQPIKWTDRKFPFGFENGYLPFFLERLRGTAPRLEEIIGGTSEIIGALKSNSEWSIKEHIGHLTDLETLHGGRIDDFIAGLEILRPADMTNAGTYQADHNATPLPQLLADFRATRNKFIARIESLDESMFVRKALHPRLKEMITITDLMYFVAEHDCHHLAKVAALVRL